MFAKGKRLIKAGVPFSIRSWLRCKELRVKRGFLPLKRIRNFGAFGRVTPISRDFGWTRGTPIDRYYIEQFLSRHAHDIRGHVAEFQTNRYTRQFGSACVTRSDVIHNAGGNPLATIVTDITDGAGIPSSTFDCVLCTQVLLLVYDFRSAIKTLHRILKPGGVLLLTVPGIGHKRIGVDEGPDYWRFTTASVQRLFQEVFPADSLEIGAYGNVLAALALLHGLATEELKADELNYTDPEYELSIGVRAVRPQLG